METPPRSLRAWRAQTLAMSSSLSTHFPAPASLPPPHPGPLASRRVRNELSAVVTGLQIQSREPPGRARRRRGGAAPAGGGEEEGGVRLHFASRGHQPRGPPCLQLGTRGPAAPGCAPLAGLHGDAAGAPGTPSSAAGPGGRGLKASLGTLRATKETCFSIPSLVPLFTLHPETSEVAEDWEGGRADRPSRPRSGGWRSPALKGSVGTPRQGLWGLEDRGLGLGLGLGLRREPLSLLSGARGPLPWRTPPRPPAAPNLQNKGSGSKAGVREWRWREAGGGGREGASPYFLSRPKFGKLLPAHTSLMLLQNREGSGSLPNGGTRSLPPPASPPPPGMVAGELRGCGARRRRRRAEPRGSSASCRCRAPPQPPRRTGS